MMTWHLRMLGCLVMACALSVAGPAGTAGSENVGVRGEDAAATAVANEMPQGGGDAAALQAAPLVEIPAASAEPVAAGPGVPAVEKGGAGTLLVDQAIVDQAMSSYSFTLKQLVSQAEQNLARIQKVLAEKAKSKAEKAAAASPAPSVLPANPEQASPQAVSGKKPSPQARREAYEKSRQERAAQRQAEQAAACAERRKCEVERKARRASRAAAQAPRHADQRSSVRAEHACVNTALPARPVETAGTAMATNRTGSLSPAVVTCVSAADATPEQFLAKQAMQERAIACEQARFAGEWARRDRLPQNELIDTSDPAVLMARQTCQEAAIAREEARFAADNRQCPSGQIRRITAADMARAQETYCVSPEEDIADARAYAARQGACRK